MEELEKYRYPIIGGVIGGVVAIAFFTLGFWKTILLLIFIVIGIFVALYLQRTGLIEQFKNRK
ncbi:DUF2273 domain-containing protein [Lactococcus taiwanensis]|jgi:uncharacterized membrane protein|uniref:DUF2273 domain-containing protein n=1 Tax=Lactococcus taiwanensis TaxID=1151742 RepID=A0AA45KHH0_9LACT|nr:DUF2273 domain-containing protein [Lactococcus taiwanensis]QRZ10245.1 DUF2273 domain-containing protein [Lactococcus taiwanensis]QRZ11217.1 DUF2273 domain-containing protein [Lactococcus taiwanensis]QSE76369.1 DUF2273 domain-containing protein [Lactococcus taiwanensis]QSE77392.1 DUF2273 domain-containing protein [Lactococcus taiwanensis]